MCIIQQKISLITRLLRQFSDLFFDQSHYEVIYELLEECGIKMAIITVP